MKYNDNLTSRLAGSLPLLSILTVDKFV